MSARRMVALALVGMFVGWWLCPVRGYAAELHSVNAWVQPYGGCKEAWQAPRSAGARQCRAHGWTVTRHIVVGPHRWVRYVDLPLCRFEDGSGQRSACTWNLSIQRQGNGVGLRYWVDRHDRPHYVRGMIWQRYIR